MNKAQLIKQIFEKKSYLCIGLDPDLEKIPEHLKVTDHPIFEFNKAIIDATRNYCVAYKPNSAFYESMGDAGWRALKKTIEYIGNSHLVIVDAKRGDIGNTSKKYAESVFDWLQADAVTVHPYMGKDSIDAYLQYDDKWVVLLAVTSNKSANDFQFLDVGDKKLFHKVVEKGAEWASNDKLMFVTGATRPQLLKRIRQIVPDYFLLVPGVGAQGGNLKEVTNAAVTSDCCLLVNVSRGILYQSNGTDFAIAAAAEAERIQKEMSSYLDSVVLKSETNR